MDVSDCLRGIGRRLAPALGRDSAGGRGPHRRFGEDIGDGGGRGPVRFARRRGHRTSCRRCGPGRIPCRLESARARRRLDVRSVARLAPFRRVEVGRHGRRRICRPLSVCLGTVSWRAGPVRGRDGRQSRRGGGARTVRRRPRRFRELRPQPDCGGVSQVTRRRADGGADGKRRCRGNGRPSRGRRGRLHGRDGRRRHHEPSAGCQRPFRTHGLRRRLRDRRMYGAA